MSAKDNGGPAFPMPTGYVPLGGVEHWNKQQFGMTLRDYFAAKAMHASLTSLVPLMDSNDKPVEYVSEVAEVAYRIADAMLKARQS